MLHGRVTHEAVALVPRLFSLCGRAQGAAAAMAAEAALGSPASADIRKARSRLVLAEIVRESLWRILIDWPAGAGLPPRAQAVAAMRAAFDAPADDGSWSSALGALRELLRREVLGRDPAQWLELESLQDWCAETGTVAARSLHSLARHGRFGSGGVALMPQPDEAWLQETAEAMRGGTFAQRPEWRGAPLETGALARRRRHPLLKALLDEGEPVLARFAARLVELARLATGGDESEWSGSQPLGGGAGLGWVETARGLLLHRVETGGGRVRDYRIVAPTEWNFHPDGALARGLSGMPAASAEEARVRAGWLAQSLDPCVECEVSVTGRGE